MKLVHKLKNGQATILGDKEVEVERYPLWGRYSGNSGYARKCRWRRYVTHYGMDCCRMIPVWRRKRWTGPQGVSGALCGRVKVIDSETNIRKLLAVQNWKAREPEAKFRTAICLIERRKALVQGIVGRNHPGEKKLRLRLRPVCSCRLCREVCGDGAEEKNRIPVRR